MGRQLRRVPLDFAWPLDTVYEGFLNPHYGKASKCEACDGSGSSPEGKLLQDRWYGYVEFKPEDRGSTPFLPTHPIIRHRAERNVPAEGAQYCGFNPNRSRREAELKFGYDAFGDEEKKAFDKIIDEAITQMREALIQVEAQRLADLFNGQWSHHLNQADVDVLVEKGRLYDFTKEFVPGTGWTEKVPAVNPTPEQVNTWSIDYGIGHDSINQWIVCGAEAERLGIETRCKHCDGEGRIWPSEEVRLAYEGWEPTEPPTGEGYQMWETVSEGSPISPVFKTPHELARHMARTRWGADEGTSYEAWMTMICGSGWAPSMLGSNQFGILNGVQGAYVLDNPEEPDEQDIDPDYNESREDDEFREWDRKWG